jgi:hypothetical protein
MKLKEEKIVDSFYSFFFKKKKLVERVKAKKIKIKEK